ncbi:MCP four helix bundle domain-containing protein [Pedobacter frigoris]|uniref:MCP four helix bundle domain-containing protein n=1 Tax=Pedobacter frigoris TaxID=2571272 RepID=UPI00292DE4F7|nr:MCP four helix bundle domain-containing protein [Pedobacter frigoris]
MRFAYSVKQKMKIAILLFCIMACTILIRFLEDKSVKSMNESFISLYNDRLIPATDLFYIAEYVDQKRSLIEDMLYSSSENTFDFEGLRRNLHKINTSIDSLIHAYEKTYLVKQEKENIAELKANLHAVKTIEKQTVDIVKNQGLQKARNVHELMGRKASGDIIKGLSELMRIQRMVGAELTKDTEFMVSGNKLYSAFQTVLAIVIGILIVGIVFTSNVVNIRSDKFNLN